MSTSSSKSKPLYLSREFPPPLFSSVSSSPCKPTISPALSPLPLPSLPLLCQGLSAAAFGRWSWANENRQQSKGSAFHNLESREKISRSFCRRDKPWSGLFVVVGGSFSFLSFLLHSSRKSPAESTDGGKQDWTFVGNELAGFHSCCRGKMSGWVK